MPDLFPTTEEAAHEQAREIGIVNHLGPDSFKPNGLRPFFEYEGYGEHKLVAGSTVYQPPGIKHKEIAHSDDFEVLEITMPAEFATLTAE